MSTPTPTPEQLPASPAAWRMSARRVGLVGGTIFDLDRYRSASNIDYKQFLHLRVLWKMARQYEFAINMKDWIAEEHYKKAKKTLKNIKFWEHYIGSFNKPRKQLRNGNLMKLGIFAHARQLQMQVVETCKFDEEPTPKFSPIASRTRSSRLQRDDPPCPETPTPRPRTGPPLSQLFDALALDDDEESQPTPESARSDLPEFASPAARETAAQFPPTADEQIVNSALVIFLSSVILPLDTADWMLYRKIFRIGKSKKTNKKGFEARVDGFLRHHSSGAVMAILEVKSCIREKKQSYIQMQEAAQMAAWISSCPENSESAQDTPDEDVPVRDENSFTRLLISQDRHEVYLTFATFDQAYVEYVTGKESVGVEPSELNGGPFLRMNQFGPFNINIDSHMRCLGYYVLAFTLQYCI